MPHCALFLTDVEKFTALLWSKADLNVTFQRWKLHEQRHGIPGRNLCSQYPLSGEMFSATRPIYALHNWVVKVSIPRWTAPFCRCDYAVVSDRRVSLVMLDILYVHSKCFNHEDKLRFSASNVSWWTTADKCLNFLMISVRIHSAKSY